MTAPRPPLRIIGFAVGAVLTALAVPVSVLGQTADGSVRIELGVDPEEVLVGEPFRTTVRVVAPSGFDVDLDEPALGESISIVSPPSVDDREGPVAAATFTLVAWDPDATPTATISVRFAGADGGARVRPVGLRMPRVVSVLPESGDSLVPRPARAVVPLANTRGLPLWWWFALLAGVVAAAAFAWRLLRGTAGEAAAQNPREWARHQLGPSGAGALVDAGDLEALAIRVSWVLRTYVARVSPDAGPDLTTTELVGHLANLDIAEPVVATLAELLGLADHVKFARRRLQPAEAMSLLAAARDWIEAYPHGSDDRPSRRAA